MGDQAQENVQTSNSCLVFIMLDRPDFSTIQKVCRHKKFKSNLRRNGKLRNLSGAVCVAELVSKVHADLLQHVAGDLPEVHLKKIKKI